MRDKISNQHRQTSQSVVLDVLRRSRIPLTVDQIMKRLPPRKAKDKLGNPRTWRIERIRPACTELARKGHAYKATTLGGVSDAGFPCATWAATPTLDLDGKESTE